MMRRLLWSLWMILCTGCAPAATIRTADVLAPGGFSGGITIVPFAWGFATTTLDNGGVREEARGNSAIGLSDYQTVGGTIAYAYNAADEWGLRVGVAPRVELGALYGFNRIGLETRIAALDEDRRARFSLAPSAMIAMQPWEKQGWWGRVGVDLSRRRHLKASDYLTPGAGMYLSWGNHRHQHNLGKEYGYPIRDCVEGWPGTPCGTRHPHTRGLNDLRRDELALSVPLSLTLQTLTRKGGGNFSFGVVPQAVLWAGPPEWIECQGCQQDITVRDYRETWSVTVEVGLHATSTKGMRLE